MNSKKQKAYAKLLNWIAFGIADAGVYFLLAIFSMTFEDVYNSDWTEYFSADINIIYKAIPILLYAWIGLNFLLLGYLLWKGMKKIISIINSIQKQKNAP